MTASLPLKPDQDEDTGRPEDAWLRPGSHLWVALAVLLMGLYFSYSAARLERHNDESNQRAHVQNQMAKFRFEMESRIFRSVALVTGLAAQLQVQQGMEDAQFQAMADQLLRGQPQILSLSLAPGFVIRSIYPPWGNEAAIGLRLLEDPVQKVAMMRAISEDGAVLGGPFELVQGGTALVVRIPLWTDVEGVPRYWGAASMTLDYEYMLQQAGLPELERSLRLDIVGCDATGPGGEMIRGPRLAVAEKPVKMPVFVPGGSWLISAVPQAGWHPRPWWTRPEVLARALMSLLAAMATARILHDRKRIRRLAGMDALTSLPNRRWAMHQLQRLIARNGRGGGRFALLSFDLDGFKPVNDTHGHAAGDRVLSEIARRLQDSVRPGDLVARMGGDEFLVMVPTPPEADRAWLGAVAQRVRAAIRQPVAVGTASVSVGASIGIAWFPQDGDVSEVLLHKADEAMYRAKAGESDGVVFAQDPPVA
jgi:diguanylate cyclase (GGDEF)-like protein